MKMIKGLTSILCTAALLVLGASKTSAVPGPAIVGTVTTSSTVNISIVITTNNVNTTTNKGAITSTTGQLKLDNKALLSIFADWSGNSLTVWQTAGARLAYSWQGEAQLIVVDKTGTNVLFYAGQGVNGGGISASFSLSFFDENGPYSSTSTSSNNAESYTQEDIASYELSYSNSGDTAKDVDIYGTGPNTTKYSNTASGAKQHWTESESANMNDADDGMEFFGPGDFNGISVSATVTTKGSGPGANDYLD